MEKQQLYMITQNKKLVDYLSIRSADEVYRLLAINNYIYDLETEKGWNKLFSDILSNTCIGNIESIKTILLNENDRLAYIFN